MHGQHALRFMHVEAILQRPYSPWSGSHVLRYCTICLDQPCLFTAVPVWYHVLTLAQHVQVPPAFKTIRVQPCSLGSITNGDNTSCTVCGTSTFSLDPNKTSCDACPSGAQCNGSDAFIPPLQHYHSSPNSTIIVSCPNPGACGGNRTSLLACKLVSADYMTTQSALHIWPLELWIALHKYMHCDIGDPRVTHSLYCINSFLHGSHALLAPQHGAAAACMHMPGALALDGTFTQPISVGMTATAYLHPHLGGLSSVPRHLPKKLM